MNLAMFKTPKGNKGNKKVPGLPALSPLKKIDETDEPATPNVFSPKQIAPTPNMNFISDGNPMQISSELLGIKENTKFECVINEK